MPVLPVHSYLPINRCNLPAKILGSLLFQQHPLELQIDGVSELHKGFFRQLDLIPSAELRAGAFTAYMKTFFTLSDTADSPQVEVYDRIKADYLCMLRGWMFDSNNREGAVIKGWVESRFGLLPRWHKTKINNPDEEAYTVFMHERTTGTYNTNAIEAQLDLLYSYCQYEIRRRFPQHTHIDLFRGTDFMGQYDVIDNHKSQRPVILLNNVNSLSSMPERADEFGSTVFACKTPIEKIFYFTGLLAGKLQGESEYIAIGGLYQVSLLNS